METTDSLNVYNDLVAFLPTYIKYKDIPWSSLRIGFDLNEISQGKIIQSSVKGDLINLLKDRVNLRRLVFDKLFASLVEKFSSGDPNQYTIIKSAELQANKFNRSTYFSCEYVQFNIPLNLEWEL